MTTWNSKHLAPNRAREPQRPVGGLWRCAAWIGWLVLPAWAIVAVDAVDGMEGQQAIEAGRQAFSQRKEFPWYDPQRDALRRVRVETPRESAANRGSTWQAQPAAARDYSWLETFLRWLWAILRWLFWIGLAALLALLIWLLARTFVERESRGVELGEADSEPGRTEADRIENLPFPIRLPQTDLLSEARRQYEQGNYAQAIVYLFSYKLVALDRQGLIRVTRGKTNRQYLAELLPQPPLQEMLQRTMVVFEDVFFGQHPLERDRFLSCWEQLDEFHRRIQQSSVL